MCNSHKRILCNTEITQWEHIYAEKQTQILLNCYTDWESIVQKSEAPVYIDIITCLFKASSVSSLRSLLAVIASFPNSGTPNSFSIERKNFLTSQDKYARSPESNLIPTALYLHGTSWRLSNEWQLCDSLEMITFLREWTWGY